MRAANRNAARARGSVSRGLAALLIAALALASCSTMAPSAPGQVVADRAVAQHVYLALNSDPYYYFQHVNVRVDDGVAILSGYVWTPDALYRARQIARGVPGVTRVVTSGLEQELEGRGNGRTR